MQGISFENHIERFKKNIHNAPKGIIRRHVIRQGLGDLLPELDLYETEKKWRIADVGGGLGTDSVEMAKCGHLVDYFDLSEAMVSEAKALMQKQQVAENITLPVGPFQNL